MPCGEPSHVRGLSVIISPHVRPVTGIALSRRRVWRLIVVPVACARPSRPSRPSVSDAAVGPRGARGLAHRFAGVAVDYPAIAPWSPFLGAVLAYVLGSFAVGPIVGWRGPALRLELVSAAAAFSITLIVTTFTVVGLSRNWSTARAEIRPLAIRVGVVFGGTILVWAVFMGWRVSIPTVHPFAWDTRLDAVDVAVFGVRPWLLAQAVLHQHATKSWLPYLIESGYSRGWFLANIALVLVLALHPTGPRSQRVLVAYVLQYAVLGSLVATVFSSAGPIFYAAVVGQPDPYARLLPALATTFSSDTSMGVLSYRDFLWQAYLRGNTGLTTGITAFPSIHVSSAVLMALAASSWNRWAGAVCWFSALATMFGAVALGWHYAVGTYSAAIGMMFLWWVAGRFTALAEARRVR